MYTICLTLTWPFEAGAAVLEVAPGVAGDLHNVSGQVGLGQEPTATRSLLRHSVPLPSSQASQPQRYSESTAVLLTQKSRFSMTSGLAD